MTSLQRIEALINGRSRTSFPSPAKPHFRRRTIPFRLSSGDNRQALFNRISPVYDYLNDLLSLGQHRVWKRMNVSWSGAKKGDRVLDICCGSGDLTFVASEKVGTSGQVIGLDFSGELLSVASSRQKQKLNPCYQNIEWLERNALDLPFPDAFFDAITMGYGLRNVLDRQRALEEIFRVLKPGCKASILDFNKITQPLTGMLQEWALDNIVVPTATSYGVADEYKYLKSSIQGFLTGKEQEQLALMAGFSDAKFYEIAFGQMGNLVATR